MFGRPYEIDLTKGRREAKYALPSESVAGALRDYIAPYVEVDEHARGLPGGRYSLVSLYLDTPGLDLYYDTVRGEKNRHKLRIRRYVGKPEAPAFFEVKSRVDDIIIKRRAAVRPDAIAPILGGRLPRMAHLVKPSTRGLVDLVYFRDLMDRCGASPRLRVRYTREPLLGIDDEGVRITFDRNVEGSPTASFDVYGDGRLWYPSTSHAVILEMKFNQVYPEWFGRVIRRFNLQRISIPKYVLATDAVRRLGVHAGCEGVRVYR